MNVASPRSIFERRSERIRPCHSGEPGSETRSDSQRTSMHLRRSLTGSSRRSEGENMRKGRQNDAGKQIRFSELQRFRCSVFLHPCWFVVWLHCCVRRSSSGCGYEILPFPVNSQVSKKSSRHGQGNPNSAGIGHESPRWQGEVFDHEWAGMGRNPDGNPGGWDIGRSPMLRTRGLNPKTLFQV